MIPEVIQNHAFLFPKLIHVAKSYSYNLYSGTLKITHINAQNYS